MEFRTVKFLEDNAWARRVLVLFISLFVFLRWLLASIWGLLIVSLLLYLTTETLVGVSPYGWTDLLDWFVRQSNEVAIAISTALITVLGFVLAFAVADSAWRAQRRTELRLVAGDEIHLFFEEALKHIYPIQNYAGLLLKAYNMLHKDTFDLSEFTYLGNEIIKKTPTFLESRSEVLRLGVSVHSLRSKHELIIAEKLISDCAFKNAQKALKETIDAIWFLAPIKATSAEECGRYLLAYDSKKWKRFIRVSKRTQKEMSASAGGLRGLFIGDLVKPSITTLFNFRRNLNFLNKRS